MYRIFFRACIHDEFFSAPPEISPKYFTPLRYSVEKVLLDLISIAFKVPPHSAITSTSCPVRSGQKQSCGLALEFGPSPLFLACKREAREHALFHQKWHPLYIFYRNFWGGILGNGSHSNVFKKDIRKMRE